MATKLTQQTVDTALYEGRSYMSKAGRKRWSRQVLWDDLLKGFGLRISHTNRKSFIVTYRADGRKRTRTLGTADQLTLEEARERAAELLASVVGEAPRAAGRGPKLEGVETVAQLTDAYLEGHLKPNVPSWFADQRLMRTHIKPAIGRSRIAEVTPGDLANLGNRVGRRFPGDAPRLKKLLKGMFDWAAEHGLWSRSIRQGVSAELPLPDLSGVRPKASPESPAAPEPAAEPPSTEELVESLRRSKERRLELEQRLEEVSSSGAEMLVKLNEQAAARKELSAELTRAQRDRDRAQASADGLPDPEETEKQLANLRQSVDQLLASLNEAERDRQEIADKLADTEARAGSQSRRLAQVTRARSELEVKMREVERRAAIRKTQGRPAVSRLQVASWLAAGAVAGVALVLLLQVAGGSREASTPANRQQVAPLAGADPEPNAPGLTGDSGQPGVGPATASAPPSPAANEPEEIAAGPDFSAVETAVRSWAAAWTEQRVDDYLAAYSTSFVPPDGRKRGAWASQRRNRIQRPDSIRVELGSLSQTVIAPDQVRVSFEQGYQTPTYTDRVTKTLELTWEEGGWKILAERSD